MAEARPLGPHVDDERRPYEQARGLREPRVRPDGTFAAGASKTLAVPAERAFAAFTDVELGERWLPGVALRERTTRPGRSARFDWPDGTRIAVDFAAKGEAPQPGGSGARAASRRRRCRANQDLLA